MDDEEFEKAKKNRAKNLRWNDKASEYTEQYGNAFPDSYHVSKVPPRPDTLNVFEGGAAGRGVLSEYVDEYRQKELQRALSEARFAGDEEYVRPVEASRRMKMMQDSHHPAQFAWNAANESQQPPPPPAHSPRRRGLPQEQSEYSSKYPWPPRTEANAPAVPPKDHDDVLGIDAEDDTATGWRSEYKSSSTFAPTPMGGLAAPIAGVPSAPNPKAPSYFAWEDAPAPPLPPPVSPVRERELPNKEQLRSEHSDSFIRWPMESNPPIVRHTNDESARDVFTLPDPAGDHNVLSEYDDQFAAPGVDALATAEQHAAAARRKDEIPKQFAWRRIDPYQEPTPPPPNPKRIPFTATSEYETNFTPKPITEAFQRVPNPYRPSTDVIVPTYDDSGEVGARTRSDSSEGVGKSHASPDMPVAGVRSHVEGDAPPFYAWTAVPAAESEADVPVVEVPYYKSELVQSEYAERFGKFGRGEGSGSPSAPPFHAHPKRHSYDLISGLDSTDPAEHYPRTMASEYDDQFHSFTARQMEHLHDSDVGPPGKKFRYPPNFAWSLVEAKDKAATEKPIVRRASAELNQRRNATTAPFKTERGDDCSPSQWQSEYDDSCNKLLEQQNKNQVAGLNSRDLSKAPAVFRGGNKVSPLAGAAASPFDAPNTTEYREKFTRLPLEQQARVS